MRPANGIGAGLEHVGEQLLVLDGLERHLADLQATVLDRRREVLHDRVQQAVGGEVAGGDAAGDREQGAVVGALLERGDDLLVRDLLALQVALHEGVGGLGHLVHQALAVLLGLIGQAVGDGDLTAVGRGGWGRICVLVGLHVDEVDHAGHLVLGADRDLGGHHVLAERGLQRVQRAKEVGPLAVKHVDEHQPCQVQLGRPLPQPVGMDLHAHHGVDDEHGGLAHAQRAQRVGDEARVAGRVEEIDLALLPLERAQRQGDRHLAGLLIRIGIRDRGPLDDASKTIDDPCLEQQCLV